MANATPILCFVGRSNSGKTTLIERLIQTLTQSGYRIAAIKHAGHGFDLDTEGKDSWRHKRAGASTVIVKSKTGLALFSDTEDSVLLTDLRDQYVRNVDLILAEGWKSEHYPKIAVVRDHFGEIEVTSDGLLAVISRAPVDVSVPVLHPDDIETLASLVREHFPIGDTRSPVLRK
ncbi:MAG TPA: molybdopterin-guanine dinucleotide biosynthesis protein B [Nitrospirales bacterium]|nr:molybdopterin-guanine dinucleotide biosynthesis protein B [Nitrospirales bacterium]